MGWKMMREKVALGLVLVSAAVLCASAGAQEPAPADAASSVKWTEQNLDAPASAPAARQGGLGGGLLAQRLAARMAGGGAGAGTGGAGAAAMLNGPGVDNELSAKLGGGAMARKLAGRLQADPNDARAHYWVAQLAGQQGAIDLASEHLEEAKRLDPAMGFAMDPSAVARLEEQIARDRPRSMAAQAQQDAENAMRRMAASPTVILVVLMMMVVGVVGIGALVLMLRTRNTPAAAGLVQAGAARRR